MSNLEVTRLDTMLARVCAACPLCRHARRHGKGIAVAIVRSIETRLCPFCIAYEKVHGRKAHENE
jgi:hypothetical protein